ncbi:MAG: filamentous hemagglutinin N-terminal domain-containing protein, partial [Syntrophus sp. (in: bacteria)]
TNSPNSIINWQGFSIGINELTRFIQQSGNSAILNRVIGQDPSAILGALQSNGRVFLINPNGILFGQGARIDVNGLIASTLNLSNKDFLAGKYNFTAGIKAGSIENQGTITTPMGGQVYLIAPDIKNSGIINSPKGDVILAAGHSVQLVDSADPFIAVTVSAPENSVVNLGQIIADSGRIGIYSGLISQKGIVKADSAVTGENGQILFKATKGITLDKDSITSANGSQGGKIAIRSETDTTMVSGAVTATGSEGKGGDIQILGRQVGLTDNALVDASGKSSGGTVLVGGDYQGKNPDIQNAVATYVGPETVIRADATETGDGGKVIVWSDKATRVYGKISARGGEQAGDGGFVETSGGYLDVRRAPDISAPNGKGGSWLLDPNNITIQDAGPDTYISGNPDFTTINDSAILTTGTIESALNGNSDVTVTTGSSEISIQDGNIYVNDNITWSKNKLTLNAYRNIEINKELSGSGTAQLSLLYGQGAVALNNTATYSVNAPVNLPTGNNFSTRLGSDGALKTYYVITSLGSAGSTTATDLQGMQGNLTRYYALGSNIDASATSAWNSDAGFVPVGNNTASFTGGFDGLGHTITDLYINRPATDNVGLFGYTSSAAIRNVGLVNGNITGHSEVGGLVGRFNTTGGGTATITNSSSSADVSGLYRIGGLVGVQFTSGTGSSSTIENSHTTGTVTGNWSNYDAGIGGLAGFQEGWSAGTSTISNSYHSIGLVKNLASGSTGGLVGFQGANSGTPTITNSYNTAVVTGGDYVGGLVGYSGGGTITNSYSTGAVTGAVGSTNVGGLVGYRSGGTITNSFWDIETSGKSTSAGGTGKTTSAMMTQATFDGSDWDFTSIWGIKENVSYPFLQWQFSGAPQIISGMLDVTGGGKAIKIAGNGTVLDRAYTGANGFYYFAIPSSSVVSGDALLTYISGDTNKAASVYLAAGGDMTGTSLYSNTLFAKSLSGGTMSNTTLANAKGSLSDTDIPYSVVSNNLTVDSSLAFKTPSGTVYDLNGNVTTQGASQIYGGSLALSTNVILNTGTGGNISFGDTVTGAGFSLTAESTGDLTVGGNITTQGGDVSLTATAGDITIANTVNAGTGNVTLKAGGALVNGVTTSDKNVIANSLDATAGNGIGHLNAMQTEVSNLTAENTNTGGGNRNIEFNNNGALTITNGITNSGSGNIILDNAGAIDTGSQKIQAPQGDVTMTAHSPLTIGSGGLTAEGDVTLEAAKSGGDDTLTINGPVRSNNGNVSLAAGSAIVLNSTVDAPNGKVTRTVNGVLVIDNSGLTTELLQAVTQWENTSTTALNNTYIITVEQDNARTAPPPEKKEDEDKDSDKKGSTSQSEETSKAKLPYCN